MIDSSTANLASAHGARNTTSQQVSASGNHRRFDRSPSDARSDDEFSTKLAQNGIGKESVSATSITLESALQIFDFSRTSSTDLDWSLLFGPTQQATHSTLNAPASSKFTLNQADASVSDIFGRSKSDLLPDRRATSPLQEEARNKSETNDERNDPTRANTSRSNQANDNARESNLAARQQNESDQRRTNQSSSANAQDTSNARHGAASKNNQTGASAISAAVAATAQKINTAFSLGSQQGSGVKNNGSAGAIQNLTLPSSSGLSGAQHLIQSAADAQKNQAGGRNFSQLTRNPLDGFLQSGGNGQSRPAWLSDLIGQVSMARVRNQSHNQFNLQLRPESLGHVQVRLDTFHDGKVSAQIQASTQEALDMLQRDQKDLMRELRREGVNVSNDDLSFSLSPEQNSDNMPKQQNNDASPDGSSLPNGFRAGNMMIPNLHVSDTSTLSERMTASLPTGSAGTIDLIY